MAQGRSPREDGEGIADVYVRRDGGPVGVVGGSASQGSWTPCTYLTVGVEQDTSAIAGVPTP